MDAIESVEKEVEKVIAKFTDIKNQSNTIINEILQITTSSRLSLSK